MPATRLSPWHEALRRRRLVVVPLLGILLAAGILSLRTWLGPEADDRLPAVQYVLNQALEQPLGDCHIEAVEWGPSQLSVFLDAPESGRLNLTPSLVAGRVLLQRPDVVVSYFWSDKPPACVEALAGRLFNAVPERFWPVVRGLEPCRFCSGSTAPLVEVPVRFPSGVRGNAGPNAIVRYIPSERIRTVLWWLFALFGWLLWIVPPLMSPFVLRLPSRPSRTAHVWGRSNRVERWLHSTALRVGLYGSFLVWLNMLLRQKTLPLRAVNFEYEAYLDTAMLCARGAECALAGQPMGSLCVRMGPLFYQLLTPLVGWGNGVDHLFDLVVVAAALGGASLAILNDRLFGAPWGLASAVAVSLSTWLVPALATPQHGALLPLSLAGFAWGFSSWMGRQGGRGFVILVASLCAATQLHATALFLVIGVVFAALLTRPPTPNFAWKWGAWVTALAYLPWLVFYVGRRFDDFALIRVVPGDNQMVGDWWKYGLLHLPPWTILLGVCAFAWRAWRDDSPEWRSFARAWLLVSVPLGGLYTVFHRGWFTQYFFVHAPILACLFAAGFSMADWLLPIRSRLPSILKPIVWIAIVLLLRASILNPQLTPLPRFPRAGQPMGWGEMKAIASAAGVFVAAPDQQDHVHGVQWNRLDVPRPLLTGMQPHQVPEVSGAPQVLIVPDCSAVSATFSSGQRRVRPNERAFVVAPYAGRLSLWNASLIDGSEELWRTTLRLPFSDADIQLDFNFLDRVYPQVFRAQQLTTLDPGNRPIPVSALWNERPEARLHLAGSYQRESADRVLALKSSDGSKVSILIGDQPGSTVNPSPVIWMSTQTNYYKLPEGPVGSKVPIELIVQNDPSSGGRGFPLELDVYESPWPQCAAP